MLRLAVTAVLVLLGSLSSGCVQRAVERGTLVYAGDWDMPPAFHGNPVAAGGLNSASGFVFEPLFVYVPATKSFVPRLGVRFEESADRRILRVQVRRDAVWHDGVAFTSRDVKASTYIGYLRGIPVWASLLDIRCPDDETVEFEWARDSDANLIRALTEPIVCPEHLFKKWAEACAPLIAARPAEDPVVEAEAQQKIREEMLAFHPPIPIGTGPFRLQRVTGSDLLLERFDRHYAVRDIHVERVHLLRWGSNEVVWSYLMGGEIDAAGAACPFDVAEQILRRNPGMRLCTPSDRNEMGLLFNCAAGPAASLNFRRAVAYALDRDVLRKVSNPYGASVTDYSLGLLDSVRDVWLAPAIYSQLTRYDHDPAKARTMLERAGYRFDGQWLDGSGRPVSLEILAAAGQSDIVLLAESAAAQLTEFGLPAQVRVVPWELYSGAIAEHRFDMAACLGVQLGKYDDPAACYNRFYLPGAQLQVGAGLPATLDGVDTALAADLLNDRLSDGARMAVTASLARVTNEQLPFLTCYEKRLNIFTLEGRRVTGWPAPEDAIWSAAPGGFEYVVATLLVQGRVRALR